VPNDADALVIIDATIDLDPLARLARRLKGSAQTIKLGADVFLADQVGRYLRRMCHYRDCHPAARSAAAGTHCCH
jgi:hypothetical protein